MNPPIQIVPNLAVADVERSIAFYRDVLGMRVTMTVDANQNYSMEEPVEKPVFAVLDLEGATLMVQEVGNLAGELPGFPRAVPEQPTGTIYFRMHDPDAVAARARGDQRLKGPEVTWYRMREVYLRDPDGHVVCVGNRAEES